MPRPHTLPTYPAVMRVLRIDEPDHSAISVEHHGAFDIRTSLNYLLGSVAPRSSADFKTRSAQSVWAERLVFGSCAFPDGAVVLANTDDLGKLIGFVAADAHHERDRRSRHRLDAAFSAPIEAAQTLSG